MTSQHIGLLIVAAAAWLPISMFLVKELFKSKEEKHKFKLFALRDELLHLVASGQLPEQSWLFKVFYGALSSSINEVRNLTIYNLVKASIEAKSELEKQKTEQFIASINSASPSVREFVDKFAHVMMDIMRANSPALRFTIFAKNNLGQWFGKMKKFLFIPVFAP